MLEVLIPAKATALITLERARQTLSCPETRVDNSTLAQFIRDASRVVADHCRRTFVLETVRETFIDSDLRAGGPILARGPVIEITRVLSNADVVLSTGYRLDATTGRLWCVDADGRVLPWWGGSLTVEYRAGYDVPNLDTGPALPEAIERATILLVGSYISLRSRDPAVKSETLDSIGSTEYWVMGASNKLISPEAEQLLVPYIRFYP